MKKNFIDNEANPLSFIKKGKPIVFIGNGLKPNSNTRVFLNNYDVTEFVLPTEIIQVEFTLEDAPTTSSGRSKIKDWRKDFNNGEKFYIQDTSIPGGGKKSIARGRVSHIEIVSQNTVSNIGVANVYVFIESPGEDNSYSKIHTERVITSNITFLTSEDKNRDNRNHGFANNRIITYYPKYSLVNVATSNTIQVGGKVTNSQFANTVTTGSKVYVVLGQGAGQNLIVSSVNTATRSITFQENWDLEPGDVSNNEIFFDERSMVRFGELKTDSTGTISGAIYVPSILDGDTTEGVRGWKYYRKWNNWNKRFKVYDGKNKVTFLCDDFDTTTVTSQVDQATNSGTVTETNPSSTASGGSVTPAPTISSTYSSTPFAQTFFVDDQIYPQGLSLLSCKLLFNEKDEEYPVQIQIRPTTAGIPDSVSVITNGNAFLQPYDIKTVSQNTLSQLYIANTNPFSSNTYYSEAFFNKPVFLESGKSYAIVVMTSSPNHKIYISQIGEKLIGTDRTVSTQPYLGILYKSQGTSEWNASPNEDLCFELTKATYDTTTPSIVDFYLKTLPEDIDNYGIQGTLLLEETAPLTTINLNSFYVTNPETLPANTTIKYEFKTTRLDGTKDGFKNFELDKTYEFYDTFGTRVLTTANDSFVIRASLSTRNPDIAPVLDFSDLTLIRIANVIDDNSISNSDIYITNYGQDYQNSAQVSVTITGGGGSGATAVANVVNGIVDAIYVTNGGSGYTESPTITITRDSTATINAQAVIIGEDQPNGGVADAKYITKKITLADDFTAGDLRVVFNAYKPSEAKIDVYYKVLSEDDFDSFENKRWTRMTLIGGINDFSKTVGEFRTFIYAPGKNNIADNYINYDGFTTFKYFAIKIVMRSIDSSKIPIIKDFRATALAGLLT